MVVKTVDRACLGFEPYKGNVDEIEPFEARKHVVSSDAFGYAYCKNWKKPGP